MTHHTTTPQHAPQHHTTTHHAPQRHNTTTPQHHNTMHGNTTTPQHHNTTTSQRHNITTSHHKWIFARRISRPRLWQLSLSLLLPLLSRYNQRATYASRDQIDLHSLRGLHLARTQALLSFLLLLHDTQQDQIHLATNAVVVGVTAMAHATVNA